jgi:hypothetical protein
MESRTSGKPFWDLFDALPPEVQRDAVKAYRLFRRDPFTRVSSSRKWTTNMASGQHG